MAYGYPEGALERLQAEQRAILGAVAQVCEALGLTWFADSGTCLGAVRHGGFIPWDDDIDIALPLDDYRRFCAEAPRLLPPEFALYTPAETPGYPPLWAKVHRRGTRFMSEQMMDAGFQQGIFVDVFAYARLDSRERTAARQVRGMLRWQRLSYLRTIAHPKLPEGLPARRLVQAGCAAAHRLVRLVFSPAAIERRFYRHVERGDGGGPWCDVFYPTYGTYDDEVLFPPATLPFDDMTVKVPRKAEEYLGIMFGDWHEPPAPEQRGAHPPLVLDFGDGANVMENAR